MRTDPSILLVRRDNIGDLACTTPLIDALHRRFPQAQLCALVTRYNRAVLEHHPAIDAVYAYTKAKHLAPDEGRIANYASRLRLMLTLRRRRFDYCVLAAPGYPNRTLGIARWVAARHVVAFVEEGKRHASIIDRPVSWRFDAAQTETEDVFGLARAFGIEADPGPLSIVPDRRAVARWANAVLELRSRCSHVIGIHISARKPSQRWPAERFAELMEALHGRHDCGFVLLWAPGDEHDPRHPGDDAKAQTVEAAVRALPVLPVPTSELTDLIAAVSLCDTFICADGGAMHLAAGTGKPIVCLFGKSSAARWRPWGVPYRLIQKPSQEVADIAVAEAAAAYADLRKQIEAGQ